MTAATTEHTGGGNRKKTRRTFGSVRKLPSGRYQARYTAPDGYEHRAPHTFLTKSDADRWLAGEQTDILRQVWAPPALVQAQKVAEVATRFGEYARSVVLNRRQNIRRTTRANYERLLGTMEVFDKLLLREITAELVETWYASMEDRAATRGNAYVLLKSIMRSAVEEGKIDRSPCLIKAGSPPKVRVPRALTVSELERYLEAADPNYRALLALCGWCALRSGEARALRVKDLNLEAGIVRVEQGLTFVAKKGYEQGQPKTEAGARTVAIPARIVPLLKSWVESRGGKDEDLLFGFNGRPLSETALREAHNRAVKAAGLEEGFTVHGLRHTALTLAAQTGATIAELQARAGHKDVKAAARYQHASAERDKEIAERLSNL